MQIKQTCVVRLFLHCKESRIHKHDEQIPHNCTYANVLSFSHSNQIVLEQTTLDYCTAWRQCLCTAKTTSQLALVLVHFLATRGPRQLRVDWPATVFFERDASWCSGLRARPRVTDCERVDGRRLHEFEGDELARVEVALLTVTSVGFCWKHNNVHNTL